MISTFSVHRDKLQGHNKRHTNLCSANCSRCIIKICVYTCIGQAFHVEYIYGVKFWRQNLRPRRPSTKFSLHYLGD